MDSGENDWGNLSFGEDSLNHYQKQDVSMGSDGNQADEDFASSLGMYDGYDSFNDSGASSDNEDLDTSLLDADEDILDQDEGASKYKFLNNTDGMATCERCGNVGVKHAFYSKSKRFCSLACSRSASQKEGKPAKLSLPSAAKKVKRGGKNISPKSQQNLFKASIRGDGKVFDWGPYLVSSQAGAASVSCFKHVPMSDCWDQMVEGVLVEVINTDIEVREVKVYWIATVLRICGYKVLLRYEGFGSDGSKDFWGNLLSEDVHSVGWCATFGKMLTPPRTIKDKYTDWKDFLIKRLTGTRTIPHDFYGKSKDWLNEFKIRQGMQLEVVNKMCVSAMRVANIKEVIGGRLKLNYADTGGEIDEFWCHMTSALIHPVGWSQTIGHKLHAPHEYINSCLSKVNTKKYSATDVTPEMFPKQNETPHGLSFQVGMKLEAIDPLNLSAICVATVAKVLRNNYLMIGIDGSMAQNGSDWFCYHATSPCIFPVGFCEINNLALTPPRGAQVPFKWFDYLKETRSMAAPVKLFDKDIPKHGFRVGMKVEAVDLMEPRLICVATVTKVVGRLLRIHFDGWENNYDQWIDCQSPDIYPSGWCEVMKHGLEGPRSRLEGGTQLTSIHVNSRKRKGKSQSFRGPRKKRNSVSDKRSSQPGRPPYNTEPYGQSAVVPGASTPTKESQFPPHKMLSPETVAATLPPLLEPDVDSRSNGVKSEMASPQPASDANPPILSPHGKIPKGFSQELAERLTTHTPILKSGFNSSSAISEKAAQPRVTGAALVTSLSMESKSNLVTSLSSGDHDPSEAGDSTIVLTLSSRLRALHLKKWSLSDVVDVLKVNGCGAYSNMFIKKNIDGATLMAMTTEELEELMTPVLGPSGRLGDLVGQVKDGAARNKDEL